jgi:hypothetical protein
MKKIRRSKIVEGTSIPGMICNGGQYFYIGVDIYEDGLSMSECTWVIWILKIGITKESSIDRMRKGKCNEIFYLLG